MRAAALLLAAAVPLACGDAGSGAGRDAADQPLRPDPGPPPTLVEGPLIDHVDPFIATGGVGFGVGSALPGATAPFGLVKVSPDTTSPNGRPGWSHCAGYAYGDPLIVGFTHTHMHGTGVPDYGNILFLPAAVEPGGRPPARDEAVPYDKASEAAAAGYYAVTLDDGTRVELTASSRAAVHRYTFPEGTEELLLVDVLAAIPDGRVPESDLDLRPADRLVEGWAHNDGPITQRSGGLSVFFSASFNRPFYPHPDEPTVLRFQPGEGPVVVHVGLSFVDLEGARRNREAEVEGRDFDEVRAATEASWEAELGRIRVAGVACRAVRLLQLGRIRRRKRLC